MCHFVFLIPQWTKKQLSITTLSYDLPNVRSEFISQFFYFYDFFKIKNEKELVLNENGLYKYT